MPRGYLAVMAAFNKGVGEKMGVITTPSQNLGGGGGRMNNQYTINVSEIQKTSCMMNLHGLKFNPCYISSS